MRSLAQRLTFSFAAFVIVGSVVLVFWVGMEERRNSRAQFATSAETNAKFIRTQHLPLTERTAAALSDVLGLSVRFHRPGMDPEWIPNEALPSQIGAGAMQMVTKRGGVQVSENGWEWVAAPAHSGAWLVLARHFETPLVRAKTLPVLVAFWLMSAALAWVLASGVVGPLRKVAEELPRIADEPTEEAIPGKSRADEIGQLARAYATTKAQLLAEREARGQAERMATLGRMATSLAHEINNPVAAIRLHAQLLQSDAGLEDRERLGIVLGETARIESLVSQWMFLARPEPPLTVATDVAEMLSASIRAQSPAAAHAGVKIEEKVGPGLIVSVDRRRLIQAVANVVTNAIHAMSSNGGTLTITARQIDTQIEVTFSDTGPGFSTRALEHARELFFSEKEGGMGVGLSVTSEILRAHGGDLRISNPPMGGAAITFVLPAQSRQSPQPKHTHE